MKEYKHINLDFQVNPCDIHSEFQEYIKTKFEVRNGFYVKVIVNQMNGIHEFNK